MSKHTPGPWRAERRIAETGIAGYISVTGPGGEHVCDIFPFRQKGRPRDARANADLITTAPDLEDAAEEVLTVYEALTMASPDFKPMLSSNEWHEALNALAAALAKARGES